MILSDLPWLREASRTVFGQDHLLPVAVALYRAGRPLTVSELADQVGVNNVSSLSAPMKRLLSAGFIEQVASPATDRARPYARRASKFWDLVVELYKRGPGDEPLF